MSLHRQRLSPRPIALLHRVGNLKPDALNQLQRRPAADEDRRLERRGLRGVLRLVEEEHGGAEGASLREHHHCIVRATFCDEALEPGAGFLDRLGRVIFPERVVGGGVEEVDARCGGGGVAAVYEVEVDVEVIEGERGRLRTCLGLEDGAAGALAVEAQHLHHNGGIGGYK
ncbi:hypothetical protein CNMCM7927_008480 [Aspergillus lentulus]|nr:hypothetical protein CNMCM7927_008480 [Aspergillus lentulus]